MGRFWIGRAWFQLYWMRVRAVLAVLAYALWRRGATATLRPRLRSLRARLHGGALARWRRPARSFIGTGAWHLLQHQRPQPLRQRRPSARRDWPTRKGAAGLSRSVPQPRITDVTLDVQLYPRRSACRDHAAATRIREPHAAPPIAEVHVQLGPSALKLDRAGTRRRHAGQKDWPRVPLPHLQVRSGRWQPGEVRELRFATTLERARVSATARPLTRIVANGTFIDNSEITPLLGCRPRRSAERPRQAPQVRPADRSCGRPSWKTMRPRAQRLARRQRLGRRPTSRVTTDADQTPIAPGLQARATRRQDGRAHRALRSRRADPPLLLDPVGALRGQDATQWHEGVDLAVYYHPAPRVQRRPHAGRDEGVARRFQRAVLAVPVPARRASSSSRRTRTSRSRSPTPCRIRRHRLHRAARRSGEDRLRHLRDRARDRPPVVGAPGHRRRQAGRDDAVGNVSRSTRR